MMADLLLDANSRTNLSKHLQPLERIPSVDPRRLRALKLGATSHVTLTELEAISNALFPLPLVNIIMDAPYHVRRVA